MQISSRRLGEFLVGRRVLSRDALEELLAREATEGTHLSHLLLRDHLVSEHDLVAAVASELGVPFVDLAERSILPDVWGLVPEPLARAHLAVALERGPNGVQVVMADPGDESAITTLESELGEAVLPSVAVRDDIVRLVGQMYGEIPTPPSEAPASTSAGTRLQLDELLEKVVSLDASDLHLAVGAPPVVRLQGELRRLKGYDVLNGSEARRLVLSILTQRQRERFLADGELATSHAIPGKGRFRVAAFVQRDSVGAVLRMVPADIPSVPDLGLPDAVARWVDERKGLVFICGPHGSGISTTLAALVARINRKRPCHILTIEEPIEFLHKHQLALVNQREVGEDTATFASGLRYARRQDPDVIVSGELPDVESIHQALAAAETGCLVLASLRTVDVVQTVDRIVDVFPPDQQQQVRVQLAASLRGIIVQQLVPAVDGGVALAVEMLLPTPEVVTAIRSGDTSRLAKALITGVGEGMITMDQSLASLVQEGIVDLDVAADRAADPDELRYLLSTEDD